MSPLSPAGRNLVLAGAFLGWMLAGMQLSMTALAVGPAATDLLAIDVPEGGKLEPDDDRLVAQWFGWLTAVFLTGTALGGLVFGWIGDRAGRSKALALAIFCYSLMSGLAYFSQDHWQFLVLRFLAGLGVGGTWPNGVSLVSEAWTNLTRPLLAGVMGAAANVGILFMSQLASINAITPDSWRWVMLVGVAPLLLALFVALFVPESPRWLASLRTEERRNTDPAPVLEIFRRPLLSTTLIGIGLATVPLIGGWGSANWMMRWADQVVRVSRADQESERFTSVEKQSVDPRLKARLARARALTGTLGALLGGWLASLFGRRRSYFPDQPVRTGQCPVLLLVPGAGRSGFLVLVCGTGILQRCLFRLAPTFPAGIVRHPGSLDGFRCLFQFRPHIDRGYGAGNLGSGRHLRQQLCCDRKDHQFDLRPSA